MATLNYTVLQGETVFDIAAKLYADFMSGISDLIMLNNLNLDAPLPAVLIYTPNKTRYIKKINVPIQSDPAKVFVTREGQTHFDLAIQLYGRLDRIGNVLAGLPSLDIAIATGTQMEYPEKESQESLLFRSVLVATGNGSRGDKDYLLQESGFKITLDDGTGSILL